MSTLTQNIIDQSDARTQCPDHDVGHIQAPILMWAGFNALIMACIVAFVTFFFKKVTINKAEPILFVMLYLFQAYHPS
jgi:hypothetical protein